MITTGGEHANFGEGPNRIWSQFPNNSASRGGSEDAKPAAHYASENCGDEPAGDSTTADTPPTESC